MTKTTKELGDAVETVIEQAFLLSADLGNEVRRVLSAGREAPLGVEETQTILELAVARLQADARAREDEATLESLAGDAATIAESLIRKSRRSERRTGARDATVTFPLQSYNDIEPGNVVPTPVYHGVHVPMRCGYARTREVNLWDRNERLEIHLNQFRAREDREPTADELLDIMLGLADLPGLSEESDQFEVKKLARSIVANGVQKAPIVDIDGTLLDGNRRVAACYLILNSNEYTAEDKKRAEWIFVWQLTPQARKEHRDAVVVALNFEDDCKVKWPEYVKARKVYEAWQDILAREPRTPNAREQAKLKKALSIKFALGPNTTTVNRYLKMVEWADTFEDHHINARERDLYEVKHRANKYFQYFEEMAKGVNPGGVAHCLTQDDTFREIVFDLLYEGKFRNWRDIRQLKEIFDNQEARDALIKARDETDSGEAENHLESAMAIARLQRAEARTLGVNTRIESFTKWLDDLPAKAYRESIKAENLRALLVALKTAEDNASGVSGVVDEEAGFCDNCGRPRV